MSGKADSIRERRARESWENGGRRAKTATKTMPLAYLVAAKFDDSREQLAVLEKLYYGRIDLEYLSWNGRTR